MHLSQEEEKHFYRLLRSLAQFVGSRHYLTVGQKDLRTDESIDVEQMAKVTEYLWDHADEEMDACLRENPDHLDPEDREIISKWRKARPENYILERILKKGAMLIGPDNNVFCVSGLQSE